MKHRSKIIFKTAGVLLDEMRDKGLNALNYKVIILDEVHERSVESDLVLVCVKQLMLRNNGIRWVLLIYITQLSSSIIIYVIHFIPLQGGLDVCYG